MKEGMNILKLFHGLTQIPGISYGFSNAVCNFLELNKTRTIGSLNEEEVKKIEDMVKEPVKHGMPKYMINRRMDVETGEDRHLLSSDLRLKIKVFQLGKGLSFNQTILFNEFKYLLKIIF